MKCPRCGSGDTVSHFGVYKCRNCKCYFHPEDVEKTIVESNSGSGNQFKKEKQ